MLCTSGKAGLPVPGGGEPEEEACEPLPRPLSLPCACACACEPLRRPLPAWDRGVEARLLPRELLRERELRPRREDFFLPLLLSLLVLLGDAAADATDAAAALVSMVRAPGIPLGEGEVEVDDTAGDVLDTPPPVAVDETGDEEDKGGEGSMLPETSFFSIISLSESLTKDRVGTLSGHSLDRRANRCRELEMRWKEINTFE